MGYMCHHAIIVSSFDKYAEDARNKALEIFENCENRLSVVSEILTTINGTTSFFIAPDGSKEGWNESNSFEEKRKEFINWLKTQYRYDWALIQYGDDESDNRLLEASGNAGDL